MLSREGKQTDRGAVGAEFIGYNRRRREALLLQEFPHQPNCRPSVPAGLNQEIQDFALTVHGTPEIELPPSNYDDHLVQVPAFGRSWPPTLNPPRIGPTEFQDPSSNCLIRDVETTLGKQVLNVPIAQRETAIEPDGMLDDDRWKAVTTVGYLAHPETLKHRPCRSHAVNVTMPGLPMGRRRTARLMRENGLAARQKRRFKRTTDSTHTWPIAPNLLDQDFAAEAPDQKWSADISYIWTAEGWLYLAVLIDLFSRRIVGWAVSDRLKKDLALRALRMALVTRHPPRGLIHHSDRGSQYCSIDYQAVLKKHGLLISMSGKGNCYDNAVVETFFKTIKSELIWPVAWQTRGQAENAVARYIDGFYNPIRRHSTLGYQSPVHFEMAGRE